MLEPTAIPVKVADGVMYGADDIVGMYVRTRLRQAQAPDFELATADGQRLFSALGVVRSGVLIGGVVYHNLYKQGGKNVCIQASFAFDRPTWASRTTLRRLFGYPFEQLGCATMVVQVRKSNKRSRKVVKGLGFNLVGPIPHAFDGKEDMMIYAITKNECRWIKDKI